MRALIVTAADEGFMPLLRGLLLSLGQCQPRPFTDIGVLDLGLSAASREWVAGHASQVVEAGWDLQLPLAVREAHPHARAMTARPFLPDYFPGYDIYLWMDADTWVQQPFALKWLIAASARGALAIAPEVDRAYRQAAGHVKWRMEHLRSYYGEAAAQRAVWATYVNSGVFALRGDAPHWKLWASYFARGIEACGGDHHTDQAAMNHMLWTENAPVHYMSALCNWNCHLALPAWDPKRQLFCEPGLPHQPVGVIHLTAHTKDGKLPGGRSLRYPEG